MNQPDVGRFYEAAAAARDRLTTCERIAAARHVHDALGALARLRCCDKQGSRGELAKAVRDIERRLEDLAEHACLGNDTPADPPS